ncbi:hypothetical protein SAMN02745135_01174 [Caloranaerobacter azorensis DSM 13643]|uniref:Uncharacterized protein n=1 Tax=Caloranaerobacter azorensis DSM 13643 TaxID=1121264 RepID=A0A1M5TXF1_9FIRM|nr:hypothetical protein [Caloranaerobacter azorensis]SHH55063.1 hypothetical protein SAMN02745135_01174 [Caloranaerobacter azorensis DSM 13643]
MKNDKQINRKPRGCLYIIIVFFAISVLVSILISMGDNSSRQAINDEDIIIDVSKFSKITPEQLIEIMGEPESKEEWNFKSRNGNVYPTTTYTYKNGDYEFLVIDNKVVEFNIYSSENNVMKYTDETSIFSMFGITPADTILKVKGTGTALRYESVTDKIEDFWIPVLNQEDRTIDIVKVIYDRTYFGAPPRMAMTISEQTDLQIRCQNVIKSILKAPSTAKFPNITKWYFGKDREKIVVQSYVDAQNSFGAVVRSNFQITFTASGDTIISLIFDGVEYINK